MDADQELLRYINEKYSDFFSDEPLGDVFDTCESEFNGFFFTESVDKKGTINILQNIIDSKLKHIQGNPDVYDDNFRFYNEVEPIQSIKIYRIQLPVLYVIIRTESNNRDYDETLWWLLQDISKLIPVKKIEPAEIIDTRKFEPGIDW